MPLKTIIDWVGRLFNAGNASRGIQAGGSGNQQAGRDAVNLSQSSGQQAARDIINYFPAQHGKSLPRLTQLDEDLLLELFNDGAERDGTRIRAFAGSESIRIGAITAGDGRPIAEVRAALDRLEDAQLTRMIDSWTIRLSSKGRREARVLREQRLILANSHHHFDGLVALDRRQGGTAVQFSPFEPEYSPEREEAFERLVAAGAYEDLGSGSYRISPKWAPRARSLGERYLLKPPQP